MSSSRDIRMEQFTQSLELETQRGDVELHPAHMPLPSIEARTGFRPHRTGSAGEGRNSSWTPPPSAGDAVNDFGPPIEKSTDGRTATLKGKVGDGPMLHITSTRGTMSVRKEGAPPADSRRTRRQKRRLHELQRSCESSCDSINGQ